MKILIVGLGSMGKRRARLILGIMPDANIYGVDSAASRRDEASMLNITPFVSIEAAIEALCADVHNDIALPCGIDTEVLAQSTDKSIGSSAQNACFDAAFVCTAPLSHAKIIALLLQNRIAVFTELNLVSDGYDELCRLAKDKNVPLFLSSTMLYRAETQYIKREVAAFQKPVNYIYHIGQYLPDWHPWESYKNFFVGDTRTNGVREIFAIDLPWLLDAFGDVVSVHTEKDRLTELEIEYPDSFFVTLRHKNGTKGMLAVDVVSPKAVRSFEVFGEGLHVFWEGNPKELYKFDKESGQKIFVNTYESFEHDARYSDNIVENAYVDEISSFFEVLNGTGEARYSFEKDMKTLALIDEIEG